MPDVTPRPRTHDRIHLFHVPDVTPSPRTYDNLRTYCSPGTHGSPHTHTQSKGKHKQSLSPRDLFMNLDQYFTNTAALIFLIEQQGLSEISGRVEGKKKERTTHD